LKGKEKLAQPITIYVSRASKEAIQRIEEKGGKVTAVYYNRLGMRYLMAPGNFGTKRRIPRLALPIRRYLVGLFSSQKLVSYSDYYANPRTRGYLSSPVVDLSALGLAPPRIKREPALPAMSLTDLLAQSHAVLASAAQRVSLREEFKCTKEKYEQELEMARKYGYADGRTRIPRRIRL